ncbi:MAG: DEAD/DEAH box helicase, partial [Anaerolineales bacterium]
MPDIVLPKAVYARIAVNVPHVQGIFDYHLPEETSQDFKIGHLVTVPFGKQSVQGIIIEFPDVPAVPQTKAVQKILDPLPVVTLGQIKLAQSISLDTLSPLGLTLQAMIPAGLSVQSDIQYCLSEQSLALLEGGETPLADLSPSQTHLLDLIIERGPLRGRQLDRVLPHKNWRSTAGSLTRRGVLISQSTLGDPTVKPKMERQLRFRGKKTAAFKQMEDLARKGFPEALARRQAVLKMVMEGEDSIALTVIYQETGANLADIKQLALRGLVDIIEVHVLRDPLEEIKISPGPTPVLTPDQQQAWDMIQGAFLAEKPKPLLLHGVTGSGKTEIYLRAVEKTIQEGKQAIILVPEIALTPQTVTRFMNRFPDRVGILNSELSQGERYDTWQLARQGALDIVVGPRSGLFTPFPNLGLIVVDECHDDSYYQGEISPRYHALQGAIQYAEITGAVCILGSATPDITTLYQATRGKWQILTLPERILAHREAILDQLEAADQDPSTNRYHPLNEELQAANLPSLHVVDMRTELKEGNRSIFSVPLQDKLKTTLEKNQQAILFLNRRGSATYVFCRDCGYALRCPRCETSLTAHQSDNSLRCHLCGYRRNTPQTCPACGSNRIRQIGTGTEQVESALQKLLPGIRSMRWDRDTTRTKGAHWEIMEKFSSHQA